MHEDSFLYNVREKYRRHFLGNESCISVVVAVVFAILFRKCWSSELIGVLKGVRPGLYTAIASIAGALLGFVLTGIAILIAFSSSPRLDVLRRHSRHYPTIYKVYISAIIFLAVTTLWGLASIIIDNGVQPRLWVFYLNVWTATISGLRLWRCVWVLKHIIRIATQEGSKRDAI